MLGLASTLYPRCVYKEYRKYGFSMSVRSRNSCPVGCGGRDAASFSLLAFSRLFTKCSPRQQQRAANHCATMLIFAFVYPGPSRKV